ncbi:hypothetical protein RIR_jg10219.t1 [Rhizophagus irregularis DAOM 181602=DAOM 197198]|nr:hypothetical protein RIR_jg10219.t1 [Rhizophagus irregularis DAOM 181602=DAOM 197198]
MRHNINLGILRFLTNLNIKKVNFFRHSVKEWSQKKLEKEKRSKGADLDRPSQVTTKDFVLDQQDTFYWNMSQYDM